MRRTQLARETREAGAGDGSMLGNMATCAKALWLERGKPYEAAVWGA